jgi:hypothetical protein
LCWSLSMFLCLEVFVLRIGCIKVLYLHICSCYLFLVDCFIY